jgi:O-6-methylguanine DNA methyltransferase
MTDFQSQCYTALKKVPRGMVITYAGLAEMIGRPRAHRAVGSAMNKNPFAPEVPCHRVVKSNGELGGFADDISVKIKRLQEEGVLVCDNKVVDFEKVRFNAI